MNNEQLFCNQLTDYMDAGIGVIQVRTDEILRAASAVRKTCLARGGNYFEWDAVNGIQEFKLNKLSKENNELNITGDGSLDLVDNLNKAFVFIKEKTKSLTDPVWVFINPQSYPLDTPVMQQYLLLYEKVLPNTRGTIIFVTNNEALPVPEEYQPSSIEFKLPSIDELKTSIKDLFAMVTKEYQKTANLSKEQISELASHGAGMTLGDFEKGICLAYTKSGVDLASPDFIDILKEKILDGKLEIIKQNNLLELLNPVSPDEISGMGNLKSWVKKRSNLFSDEATKYGIQPPKGIVLVGIQGTGKSTACSMIADMMGLPIIRLEVSRVFNELVGSSERRMSNALRMVQHTAPVVLMIDEITRTFAGSSSNNDAGVTQRILAKMLTFLQESKDVFVVATANSLNGLPPELLRRGRFDAIFYTALPTKTERKETLAIHLKKRNRDIAKFSHTSVESFLIASDGYIQAEIEAAVKDGLIDSFDAKEELTIAHIEFALVAMPPISRSFKDQIAATQEWGLKHAIPVSIPEQLISSQQTRLRMPGKISVTN